MGLEHRLAGEVNYAEATVKDIGVVAIEGGWQVYVGGAAGGSVRKGDVISTVETPEGGQAGGHRTGQPPASSTRLCYRCRPTAARSGSSS